jgi:Amt family ammonium transporter
MSVPAATVNLIAEYNANQTIVINALSTTVGNLKTELNTFFLLWAGALIFLMQAGFATLSAGSIREKNVKNILLKNLLDACVGAIVWYFIGYGFAYDKDGNANPFIGGGPSHFGMSGIQDSGATHEFGYDWISWYFQWAFAAAAATIVSGAVAERCQLSAYLFYTVGITGFVYPVVVHWVWDTSGFASAFSKTNVMLGGCIDFAGSGVVHMTGGWAAFVGAWVLGPRTGRFEDPASFEGHSTPLVIIGTFLLWFGWYGFNPGSTLKIDGYGRDMARVAVTTTLAAASGGVSGLFLKRWIPKSLGGSGIYDISHTCNSLLGGLVGITASCSVVTPACAVVIGIIAAFVYHGASCMMRKLKIDDPLDAFAVHGACGVWGVLSVGIFAAKEYSYSPHPDSPWRLDASGNDLGVDAGIFMPGSRGTLFGAQFCTLLCEIPWVVTTSFIIFFALNKLGLLRVPLDQEAPGLDVSKHGGSAYPEQGKVSFTSASAA